MRENRSYVFFRELTAGAARSGDRPVAAGHGAPIRA